VNTLPEGFPKIGKVEDLGKLLEKIDKKNGLPNAELYIELRGNIFLFLFVTREKHFFDDLYSSGSLYLLPCYHYLRNINVWFFDDIQSLNSDRPSIMEDLRAFDTQYRFTLMKGGDYIQVGGKVGPSYSSLYGQTIADMILYEPLFITYNGRDFKVYSDIYFRERYFYEFQLSSPYNSITKEYYPSYFVYLFFEDNKKIEGIPNFFNAAQDTNPANDPYAKFQGVWHDVDDKDALFVFIDDIFFINGDGGFSFRYSIEGNNLIMTNPRELGDDGWKEHNEPETGTGTLQYVFSGDRLILLFDGEPWVTLSRIDG
jgi:hypothetical protein